MTDALAVACITELACLPDHVYFLSGAGYSVHEEVYLAALDLGDAELSKRCLAVLAQRFPTSFRVRTLKAMGLEAAGKFDEALAAYNGILEDDQANTVSASPPARFAR